MEIAGYFAAALIGLSLGLIGGGGSILTVPVLVYLFSVPPTLAVSYSLFIVGFSSLAGALHNYRRGQVDPRAVFLFGLTSVVTVWIIRRWVVPSLPATLFEVNGFVVTQNFLVMVLFAGLMVTSSVFMIRGRERLSDAPIGSASRQLLFLGILVGMVTGFLGAGGGFLLIPALVLFLHLPMKKAVGTSLMIIAINSFVGFMGDLGRTPIDWRFLLIITLIATLGILPGVYFNRKANSHRLKRGFGWFVLVMGVYILVKEIRSLMLP